MNIKKTTIKSLKFRFNRCLAVFAVFCLLCGFAIQAPVLAATNAALALSPATASVSPGSNLTLTLTLNSGGNAVFAWQAALTYPTANFSSVSVAPAAGSPFTANPGSDTATGGNIQLSRYTTAASTYSGPVATITLTAAASGPAKIDFQHICSGTADTTPCSTVTNGAGDTLLSSITGASVTVNAGDSGGNSSGSNPAPAANPPAATPPSSAVINVHDQAGQPVAGAKVIVGGFQGTTDRQGQVSLPVQTSGEVAGTVIYQGQRQPISLNADSTGTSPNRSFNVQIKRSSAITPLTSAIAALVVVGAFIVIMRNQGINLAAIVGKFKSKSSSNYVNDQDVITDVKLPRSETLPVQPGYTVTPTSQDKRKP